MAVRYDSQLRSRIRKTVKSFNAKIRRLQQKGVSASLLPETVSSKELQAGIRSRRDLVSRLNQLDEFTSAGEVEESQGGLMGTPKLFQYRQGEANRAIKEIQKEFKRLDNMEDLRYPMMTGEYASNLRAKMNYLERDVRHLDIRQINIFSKNIITPEKLTVMNDKFYNNFQRMLFYNAYRGDISPQMLRDITELISQFTPAELLELYRTQPAFKMVVEGYERYKSEAGQPDDDENKAVNEAILAKLEEELAKKRK